MSKTTAISSPKTKLRKTAKPSTTESISQTQAVAKSVAGIQDFKLHPPSLSVIKPSVIIEGEQHIFQKLEKDSKLPEMKAIGYMDLGQGKLHNWVSYVITIKGDKVLSIEVDEPNMRQIAEEATKINFTTLFMDVDEI